MYSYVLFYKLPTVENIKTVKIQGQETKYYPAGNDTICIALRSEVELVNGEYRATEMPSLEFLWDVPAVVYDYDEYIKVMDDPSYKPVPLRPYKEDASEDSSGTT